MFRTPVAAALAMNATSGSVTLPSLRFARRVLAWLDAWYSRHHRLRTIGPVLLVGEAHYRGPEIRFPDGTLLRDHDRIGRLHFNNSRIAALGDGSVQRTGLRFAKLMRESLRELGELMQSDLQWRDVQVFQGVTWLPAHGSVVGFVSMPMPQSWKTRWLSWHFRVLARVFAPAVRTRQRDTAPRVYWLTRAALLSQKGLLNTD